MSKKKKVFVATVGGGRETPKIIGRKKIGGRVFKIATMKKKAKYAFIGGNIISFRLLGVPSNIPYDEIVYWKGQSKESAKHTITHEIDEEHLERYGFMNYHPAHDYSLKYETTNYTPHEVLRMCGGRCKK